MRRARRAFTLSELMVAVAVLLVVILATSKIFGTASRVTAVGEGTADILQEAAAIERQIRSDIAQLSRDGVFAIRSFALPNDVNGGPLLNPYLPENAIIRSDQLLFFTQGVESAQTQARQLLRTGQAVANRMYYGHAFQLADQGEPYQSNRAHDIDVLWTPWGTGSVLMARTNFGAGSNYITNFLRSDAGEVDGTQPEARQWLLARQPVLLVDDDTDVLDSPSKSLYLYQEPGDNEGFLRSGNVSAKSVFRFIPGSGADSWQVQNGRVDAAATELNDIRRAITNGGVNAWGAQRDVIAGNLLFFPRAERFAPGRNRIDQALTNHVISAACSSFIVEWTWDDGTGTAVSPSLGLLPGVGVNPARPQPWFGLTDVSRGVRPYFDWFQAVGGETGSEFGRGAVAIRSDAVDGEGLDPSSGDFIIYQAYFGYNQAEPIDPSTGALWPVNSSFTYTPWPSAIRITMVLHDTGTNLEAGREFQFVVRLPRQTSNP